MSVGMNVNGTHLVPCVLGLYGLYVEVDKKFAKRKTRE